MSYRNAIGKFGESLVVKYLLSLGYEILEKNIKLSYQEVDIIARFEGRIIFIEVKTRTSDLFGGGESELSKEKLRNLKKAIYYYSNYRKIDVDIFQIDAVLVNIDRKTKIANIKHYKKIF
jgi:putative endonuclease